jgi:phosphoesterase RecJ-like protein
MSFVGHILANKLEMIEGLPVALMTISAEELLTYKIRTGDTEGLVNFGLSIKGVEMAALIVDRTVLIKMSFRGKGKFPCHKFAAEFFSGGGHINAAGGESTESLEATSERFKTSIKKYANYLTSNAQ